MAFGVLEDIISFSIHLSIWFRSDFWGLIFGEFIKLHISQSCCSFLFNDAVWIQAHIQESWNRASLWNLVSEFLIIADYGFCTATHNVPSPDTHMLSLPSPLATDWIFPTNFQIKKIRLGNVAIRSWLLVQILSTTPTRKLLCCCIFQLRLALFSIAFSNSEIEKV